MVALPGQLFYSTQIPACLWFLARKHSKKKANEKKILFIDARSLGKMVDRTHRELSNEEIARIANTYHEWKKDSDLSSYADIPGFCKSVNVEELQKHDYVLTPGRYVGMAAVEDDSEPFDQKMKRLVNELSVQRKEAKRLDKEITTNLQTLGFTIE